MQADRPIFPCVGKLALSLAAYIRARLPAKTLPGIASRHDPVIVSSKLIAGLCVRWVLTLRRRGSADRVGTGVWACRRFRFYLAKVAADATNHRSGNSFFKEAPRMATADVLLMRRDR
jgi:hypothetical protein